MNYVPLTLHVFVVIINLSIVFVEGKTINTRSQGVTRIFRHLSNNFIFEDVDFIGDSLFNSDICVAMRTFSPRPETGCCGRHVFDAETRNDYEENSSHDEEFLTEQTQLKWKRSTQTNSHILPEKYITNGKTTTLNQFPWLVNVYSTVECGGSLISSLYVLTAAHCVKASINNNLKQTWVELGNYDKRTSPVDCVDSQSGRKCVKSVKRSVIQIHVHPCNVGGDYDLALLRLSYHVPYTENIRPICLPSINIDVPRHKDMPLIVAGWGSNGIRSSDKKQYAIVNLIPNKLCRRRWYHICAVGYNGQGTCFGDSGGPLMMNIKGKYYLAGITSAGTGACGSSRPVLFTHVYKFKKWILSKIRS